MFTWTNTMNVKRERLSEIDRFWKTKISEDEQESNIFSNNLKNKNNYGPEKSFHMRIMIYFSLTGINWAAA